MRKYLTQKRRSNVLARKPYANAQGISHMRLSQFRESAVLNRLADGNVNEDDVPGMFKYHIICGFYTSNNYIPPDYMHYSTYSGFFGLSCPELNHVFDLWSQ